MGGWSEPSRSKHPPSVVTALPPFVGRRQELEWLERCLQDAIAGRPQLVLIPGEAGIGKTRLLKEWRLLAERSGVQVCYGRCYEDLALPYLPLVEPLLSRLVHVAAGAGDAEVIRHLLRADPAASADAGPSLSLQADQEKLRLFLAVSRATIRLAQSCPTLLIIDDLHWADRSSLDLFAHLVFAAADVSGREPVALMLIGTYRPVEPEEPLAHVVARLQREAIYRPLEIRGLSESEVDELIEGLGLLHPAHQLVTTVSEATRGNPLFIQEVVHDLVAQGALREQGGHLVSAVSAADLHLPEQVTGAITARVERLSDGCRGVLTLAAVLGDRVELPTLCAVSGQAEEPLLDQLEEALHQRLVVGEGQAFQFAHPLIRHVLYSEPSAARRQLMHAHVAQTLVELYADRLDDHVLEIAHHLVAASAAADAEQVVRYSVRAGDQALTLFAWGDAARYYEAALAAADATGRFSAVQRAELHYRAGFAHYRNWDAGPCLDQYDKAIDAYRQSGDVVGLARALQEQTRAHFTLASVPYGTLIDIQPLRDALDALGDREPALQGRIWTTIAQVYWTARQPGTAKEIAQRAVEIGTRINDDRLCAEASVGLALAQMQSMDVKDALESYQSALLHARRVDDLWLQGGALQRIPGVLTRLGRLEEAEVIAAEACELTGKMHDWGEYSLALAARTQVAVARGSFDAAERYAHEAMTMVRRSRYPWGGAEALPALACARALRGAWDEARAAVEMLVQPGCVFEEPGQSIQLVAWIYRQLLLARAGVVDAVREQFATSSLPLRPTESPDVYALDAYCALVEVADYIDAPAMAEPLYQGLSLAVERGVLFSSAWIFLIPRVLGVLATLNRWWDRADAYFRAAIDAATQAGARPELGRSYLDYARMLVARGHKKDQRRIFTLVKQAAPIFDELGMQPFVRQAAQLAERLHIELPQRPPEEVSAAHAPSPATRALPDRPPFQVIFATDLEGSTALIQRLGDDRAHQLSRTHNTIIRNGLRAHQGAEFNYTGDGVMASFTSAAGAIACAIALQKTFAQHNQQYPETPLRVRIGLAAGEPVAEDGQLFGAAVNAAARICGRAQPGQILVSDVVRQLAAGKGVRFTARGRVALKGFTERFRLYAVQWESD